MSFWIFQVLFVNSLYTCSPLKVVHFTSVVNITLEVSKCPRTINSCVNANLIFFFIPPAVCVMPSPSSLRLEFNFTPCQYKTKYKQRKIHAIYAQTRFSEDNLIKLWLKLKSIQEISTQKSQLFHCVHFSRTIVILLCFCKQLLVC